MIGVSSASKGKGVGESLMEQSKKYTKSTGLKKNYVDTDKSNINAQIFYIKCEYFSKYSIKNYYEPRLVDITFICMFNYGNYFIKMPHLVKIFKIILMDFSLTFSTLSSVSDPEWSHHMKILPFDFLYH